ncbi:MAG TPA: hypothetical protein VF575_05045 [Candidatus Saccharimonadales bacterium]|jgi:hypothetical protein
MRPEVTYIKQSITHSAGHVYEHIIADSINNAYMAKGYLPLLNFELNANTLDGIIVISVEADTEAMLTDVEAILNNEVITAKAIDNAVMQISSEYKRLARYDADQLYHEINDLHAATWATRQEFSRTTPVDDVARQLNSASIKFGRLAPRSFTEFSLTYSIENCPFELKPLAVYALQGLALSHINFMNNCFNCSYDAGDEWAEHQELVGYSHRLRILTSKAPGIDDLRNIERDHRNTLFAENFPVKLRRYLLKHATDSIPYFNTKNMYAYSYQVVGHSGWKEIISDTNINKVLKKLKVEVR